jgi:hypothetical protein
MELACLGTGKYQGRFREDWHGKDGHTRPRWEVCRDLRGRLVAGIAVLQACVGIFRNGG